jgi:hypothetical protein
VLATVNRETGIFISLAFAVTDASAWRSMQVKAIPWSFLLRLAILFTTWLVIFLGLRYVRGPAAAAETIRGLQARNVTFESLMSTALNVTLFLGAFWVFAALGFFAAPSVVRRLSLIVPVYLGLIAVWGVWYEVRLLMPLYPILLPLGLSFLFPPAAAPAVSERGELRN